MHVQSFAVAEAGEGSPGDLQDGRYWLSPLVLDLVANYLDWFLQLVWIIFMEEYYLENYENRVLTLVRAQGEDLNLNQDSWRTLVQMKCFLLGKQASNQASNQASRENLLDQGLFEGGKSSP